MSRNYHLGVKVGANCVSAAVVRPGDDTSTGVSVLPLGRRGFQMPALAFVDGEGAIHVGDEARLSGVEHPENLVSEFTRGIGDDVPLVLAGRSVRPEDLLSATVAHVIDVATQREGRPPVDVALACPASWGPHRLGLVAATLADHGMPGVRLVPSVAAAAVERDAVHPLDEGEFLAVHDLGSASYQCAVFRKDEGSLALIGEPMALDDVGGADFDDAILRHALGSAGIDPASLEDTPEVRAALRQLRADCVAAKEALSFDAHTTIPVMVPGHTTAVRLTRSEFEAMTEGLVDRTVDCLDESLERAGVDPVALAAIVLAGGASRIPLVAQRLSEVFDRPIVAGDDPAAAAAVGAARIALVETGAAAEAPVPLTPVQGTDDEADEREPVALIVPPRTRSPLLRIASLVGLTALAIGGTVVLASAVTGHLDDLVAAPAALLGEPAPAASAIPTEPADRAAPSSVPDRSASASASPSGSGSPSPESTPSVAPAAQAQAALTGASAPRPARPYETVAQRKAYETEVATAEATAAASPPSTSSSRATPTTASAVPRTSSASPSTSSGTTTATSPTTPTTSQPATTTPTTSDPDPTTTDPDPTTSDPDPTTTDPDPTTTDPDPTTTDPDPTTTDPAPTTDPDPTTTDPDPTTTDPAPTTDPDPTTTDPDPTTTDPAPTTTTDPAPTTSDPTASSSETTAA